MRELKWRMWDKENNKWDYFVLASTVIYGNKLHKHLLNGDKPYPYTRSRDKTGKEIYDNNIVSWFWPAPWDEQQLIEMHGVVRWRGHMWIVDVIGIPDWFGLCDESNEKNIGLTIIGSAQENPELLEAEYKQSEAGQ